MLQDLFNYLYHQNETGGIPLKGTGILVGLVLLGTHLFALVKANQVQSFLRVFPRSRKWGIILMSVAFLWAMMCLSCMDMGEFYHLRKWFLLIVPAGFVLVAIYMQEFLAVRALGCVMLIVAGMVLQAAFLQPQTSRLLLPTIAYSAWILPGMFFVGMPYLMRDWAGWVSADATRWKAASLGGAAYGAVILVAAILWW